jgi:hypothetical protein
MCPGWLRVVDGEYQKIPERVAVVKQIFRMAIGGQGVGAICQTLNGEGIKPFGTVRKKGHNGKPHLWQKSSVGRLLTNRAVVGEYQPHEGHKQRKPVGDPVQLYPVVVSDEDYWTAQARKADRKRVGVKEASRGVNLFSGLVQAPDGCSYVYHNKGEHNTPMLARSDGLVGGKPYEAFPYPVFETVVLQHIAEIDPGELVGAGGDRAAADKLADVQGRLAAVDEKIRTFEERVYQEPQNVTWPKMLDRAREERETLLAEYQDARRAVSTPVVEALADIRTLADVLKKKPSEETRRRLRAKIASAVESVVLGVGKVGPANTAHVQVRFKYDGYTRNVLVRHVHGRTGRGYVRPPVTEVTAFVDVPDEKAVNLDELARGILAGETPARWWPVA